MSNGNIPEEVVDAVLNHRDIAEVVGRYVHLTKQGKNLKGLCPFHSERTPSFTVTPEKRLFHCFGCGKGGSVIRFVMEIESLSFPEAVRMLAEEADIRFEWNDTQPVLTEQDIVHQRIVEAHELAAKWFHYILKNTEQGAAAMEYLRSRRFTDKQIDEFQIGYAPSSWDSLVNFLEQRGFKLSLMERGGLVTARSEGNGYYDKFRERIMFPIRDGKGRAIAFAGRAIAGAEPKYLNSPETELFNKSKVLYRLDQAKSSMRKSQTAVLFEGYVDVIKAWDSGVTNGVATMGTALTEHHVRQLRKFASKVILCYDGDDAGQAAASKSIPLLEKAGLEISVSILPPKTDPDEYIASFGPERFRSEMIDSAVSSVKFRLLYLRRSHNTAIDSGKLNYIQAALKIVAQLRSPTEREHYLRELAAEFQYSPETLKQELNIWMTRQQKEPIKRDKNAIPWNNDMNDDRARPASPVLLPAFHNAERKLLAIMMNDADITEYVKEHLGDQFHNEAHAAIAAYLYAYYAEGNAPDPGRFIAVLQDDRLENAASQISMLETTIGWNQQVIDAYIREVNKVPQQKEIERRKEMMVQAERAGDVLRAAQIASEIISLERQLKYI